MHGLVLFGAALLLAASLLPVPAVVDSVSPSLGFSTISSLLYDAAFRSPVLRRRQDDGTGDDDDDDDDDSSGQTDAWSFSNSSADLLDSANTTGAGSGATMNSSAVQGVAPVAPSPNSAPLARRSPASSSNATNATASTAKKCKKGLHAQ